MSDYASEKFDRLYFRYKRFTYVYRGVEFYIRRDGIFSGCVMLSDSPNMLGNWVVLDSIPEAKIAITNYIKNITK